MFINGILRNIEILMEQSATIASLFKIFYCTRQMVGFKCEQERFANASDISAELQ